MTHLVFRTKAPAGNNKRISVAVLNALLSSTVVRIVGNVLDDAAYNEYVAQFATDEGTTIIRNTDATPSAFRQAVKTMAAATERNVSFAADECFLNGKWTTVGHVVRTLGTDDAS